MTIPFGPATPSGSSPVVLAARTGTIARGEAKSFVRPLRKATPVSVPRES